MVMAVFSHEPHSCTMSDVHLGIPCTSSMQCTQLAESPFYLVTLWKYVGRSVFVSHRISTMA